MSVSDTIARPYAQAIFEIAVDDNSIEKWKKTLFFIQEIAWHHKVKRFLSGSLSSHFLSLAFIKIANHMIDEKAKNLIKLLSEHQRLNVIKNILEQFLHLEASHKNVLIVRLKTAYALNEKEKLKIQKLLEKIFLRQINFIYTVDCHILDGIIIKVHDTVFDLSIQNYLKQLSNVLNF
jgi:F-type H+-transporting ATPase subunit delta